MLVDEVSLLAELNSIVIQKGQIKSIPSTISKLTKLQNLDMDFNNMGGPLPFTNNNNEYDSNNDNINASTAKMSEMLRVDLNYNALTGGIESLVDMPKLRHVYVDNNHFDGTIPANLGYLSDLGECTM